MILPWPSHVAAVLTSALTSLVWLFPHVCAVNKCPDFGAIFFRGNPLCRSEPAGPGSCIRYVVDSLDKRHSNQCLDTAVEEAGKSTTSTVHLGELIREGGGGLCIDLVALLALTGSGARAREYMGRGPKPDRRRLMRDGHIPSSPRRGRDHERPRNRS